MIRSEFVVTRARNDKAHTCDVFLRATGRKIGVIFEPYGRDSKGRRAGYKFHIAGRTYASAKRYSTQKQAAIAMGEALWSSRTVVL